MIKKVSNIMSAHIVDKYLCNTLQLFWVHAEFENYIIYFHHTPPKEFDVAPQLEKFKFKNFILLFSVYMCRWG